MKNIAVAIISGGMDSTVAAWKARSESEELHLVSFDYGQRHKVELEYAEVQGIGMKADSHTIIDLSSINELMQTSALTNSDIEVPEGHYADEAMKQTVVPNRNSIMLNVAAALVVSKGANRLYTGVHAGDHPVYPDCRPEFIKSVESTLRIANEGFIHPDFQIVAPFLNSYKKDIVRMGTVYGVNFPLTWSCYQGGRIQCGRCSTCVERKGAFLEADIVDLTEYSYGYKDADFLRSLLPDLTLEVLENATSRFMGTFDAFYRLGLELPR